MRSPAALGAVLAFGSILAFGAVSCHSDRVSLFLPRGGAESVILVVVSGGSVARVLAVDSSFFQSAASLPLGDIADFDVYALSYQCSLTSLSLQVGALAIDSGMDPRHGRPLPIAGAVERMHVAGRQPGSWEQVNALPDLLVGVRLTDPAYSPCVAFDIDSVTLEDSTPDMSGTFGVPLGKDAILLGVDVSTADAGRFYRVTRAGAERMTATPTSTPHQAAFRTDAGDVWLVGLDGRVAKGDLEHGFKPQPSLPTFRGNVHLAGSRGAAPFELFAFGEPLVLQRFASGAWTTVGKLTAFSGSSFDVAWVAPGEAVAVASNASAVLHFKDGLSNDEPFDPLQLPSTVIVIEGIGVVVGGDRGRLFFERDGTFVTMMSSGLVERVRVMAPLDDGLAFMDRGSALQQYHPGFGFCDSALVAPRDSNGLIPVENGFAIVPSSTHDLLRVVYLTRRSPPPVRRCAP